jgi:hypothetical protein
MALENTRTSKVLPPPLDATSTESACALPWDDAATGDPFWDNIAAHQFSGPGDVAEKHDEYLYGKWLRRRQR